MIDDKSRLISRRELLRKAVIGGGALLVLTLLPTAVAGASPPTPTGTSLEQWLLSTAKFS